MSGTTRAFYGLLAILVVLGALLTKGDLLVLLNVPGLAFVTSLLLFGLFASFGPGIVLAAFSDVFRRDATNREREIHVRVWRRAQKLAWVSGILATACSVFLLMAHVEEPDQVLPSCGMCLLPLFWAGVYAELLFDWFETLVERILDAADVPTASGTTE